MWKIKKKKKTFSVKHTHTSTMQIKHTKKRLHNFHRKITWQLIRNEQCQNELCLPTDKNQPNPRGQVIINEVQTQQSTGYCSIQMLILTPSLPGCHLKTTNTSAKCEILQSFCFLFHTGFGEDFHQNASRWMETLQDQKTDRFWRASVHLSARKFYRLGQWGG